MICAPLHSVSDNRELSQIFTSAYRGVCSFVSTRTEYTTEGWVHTSLVCLWKRRNTVHEMKMHWLLAVKYSHYVTNNMIGFQETLSMRSSFPGNTEYRGVSTPSHPAGTWRVHCRILFAQIFCDDGSLTLPLRLMCFFCYDEVQGDEAQPHKTTPTFNEVKFQSFWFERLHVTI